MLKARDSISMQPFYLGEGLVTECSVSIQGKFGFGAIMGEDPERSYQIAVVDAGFYDRLPLVDSWIPELEREERNILVNDIFGTRDGRTFARSVRHDGGLQ